MLDNENGHLFATTLREEQAAAYFSRGQLQELQLRRLRSVLTRATRFVPFYREKFAEHENWLHTLSGPDDLWRLPAICKDDLLRAAPAGHVDEREPLSRLIRRTTSGSLGPALHLYGAPTETTIHSALFWSGWMSHVTRDDRMCCLAGPQLQFQHQFVPNIFLPVTTSAAEAVARFREFQPTVIIGSVEAIGLLSRDLRQQDVPERRKVRLVFSFGQTLTPLLRAMIREGFDAEIFDLYGANESLWMGIECEAHHGLHVPLGRVIVQIAKLNQPDQPAAPGELGEVIVTSLARWTTPIIRYRIGDVAALDPAPCRCGRQTPRLQSLEGRVQDFLIATDGKWVSPGAIATDLAYGQDAILDHRIVQAASRCVRVSIVPAPSFGEPHRRRIEEVIGRHLGPMDVEIELVTQIPRDPSGKRRRVHRAFSATSF